MKPTTYSRPKDLVFPASPDVDAMEETIVRLNKALDELKAACNYKDAKIASMREAGDLAAATISIVIAFEENERTRNALEKVLNAFCEREESWNKVWKNSCSGR